jgi:hypothetical protein
MNAPKTVTDLINTMTETKALTVKPETLNVKRRLTMDATSIARLKQVICRVDGEFESIEMPPAAKGAEPGAAVAVPITDVVNNVQYLLICNSLIVSALQRATPPLTGRYFAIKSGEIKAGKRYRQVEIFELELAQ